MKFIIQKHLETKVDIISDNKQLSKLFIKILKIMNNDYTNPFFSKNINSKNDVLTMSMTENYRMDIDFKVNNYKITILNILIHDEWFSNL